MCLFEIGLFTLSMPLGSISFFFLPPPMENILPSAVFISLKELSRSIFLTEIMLQPKLVRISHNFSSVHGYTESHLAQFQYFFYNFSFMSSICLRKLYTCSFNTEKKRQHTFFLAGCSYVSEHTLTGTKYRSNTATSPSH